MPWESSDRRERLPPNWEALRRAVFTRCGGRCEMKKKDGRRCWDKATEVDHIQRGDDNDLANLRGICSWCHRRKSSAEGHAAQQQLRSILNRPAEKHPGTIGAPGTPPPNRGF